MYNRKKKTASLYTNTQERQKNTQRRHFPYLTFSIKRREGLSAAAQHITNERKNITGSELLRLKMTSILFHSLRLTFQKLERQQQQQLWDRVIVDV